MAQPLPYSMPHDGRETSFLSFDDAPNSPNPGQSPEAYTSQQIQNTYASHASSSMGDAEHIYHRNQPGSPITSATRASGSSHASPSKNSQLTKSRPSSSKSLAAAAFADASEASNRFESLHSSPPRAVGKPASSRGSRLGALLGRSLPNNDDRHSRNASSSTNQTEGTSSNDSSFFGRRNRSRAVPAQEDIDESSDPSTSASSSNPSGLYSAKTQPDASRSASAMGMLDFKSDSTLLDSSTAPNDSRSGRHRPARPSSQSNLLDTKTGGTVRNSTLPGPSSNSAPQQTRGGRLGRLAYKKDDSIAFIAQSRNASQQMAAGVRNSNLEEADSQQPSAFAAARGLGIEDIAGSYASERGANPSSTALDTRTYTLPSAHRFTPDYHNGLERVAATEAGVSVASTSARTWSATSSGSTSSRAPSVVGSHGGNYHSRFSRQGLPQQLGHEATHDSETRARQSSTDAQAAVAASTRTSYEKGSGSPRGTLSDAAIAALGAIPGASAGSVLNANGAPLSSKNILTIALQKAQIAVQLDSANNVPEAISAYKQAVRLLEEVMERIAPRNGKRSRPSREEERRRLRVIHDTYADRIRLLSMIYSPDDLDVNDETSDTSFSGSHVQPNTSKADWLDRVRDDSQENGTPLTPRLDSDQLDPETQHSPREDARSFLSITPVGATFPGSSNQASKHPPQSSQLQHPWPRSPPMPNAPLSPSLELSPRRCVRNDVRPGSRGSRSCRASLSLSIVDEQEAQAYRIPPPAIEEEMPRISIEATRPETAGTNTAASPKKEPLRDAATQIREADALAQQHVRSDSDSSYQSATTAGRLRPTAVPHRAFGLDDEVRTPITPYFDATGDASLPDEHNSGGAISPLDPQARPHKLSLTSAPKPRIEAAIPERPAEKPAKMGLAQRARALSFKGPLLRQKASMPSLGGSKKDDVVTANGGATPRGPVHQFGIAESSSTEAASMQRTDSRSNHPTPWDEEKGSNFTVRPGSNRPRASTATALVSSTTTSGTISLRRKNTQNGDRSVQGLTDELEELGLMEEADLNDSVRATSMSSRQRSTSQPGARRPSIPAAFVSANASASGGIFPSTIGSGVSPSREQVPPPVPDLARTLSALELKRSVEVGTLANAGGADASFAASNGADVTISSLVMPLPRPPLDDPPVEASVKEDGTHSTFLITDIFPSGLPSLAAGAPSYASTTGHPTASRSSASSLPTTLHPLLKPFDAMAQLRLSIVSGAQITPRLFLPRTLWRQPGVKLVSVEAKVRAIEALLAGLESVEKGGEALLMRLGSGAGLETLNASRFVKCLDEWEILLADVQNSLAKKLPFIESAAAKEGKEGAGGVKSKSFGGGFGSRFTRGLDRMTGSVGQAKTLDSISIGLYVDALSRLFAKSSVLASHLTWVLVSENVISSTTIGSIAAVGGAMSSPTAVGIAHTDRTAYSAIPPHLRVTIQSRLKRSSEFMTKVIIAFVVQDIGLLVEKSTKKGTPLFVD